MQMTLDTHTYLTAVLINQLKQDYMHTMCYKKSQLIFLWPPYVIGQAIYIFILSFVLLLFFLA